MYLKKIDDEQKQYAFRLVKGTNFGKRGHFDGNLERQYTGMLGQVVMADLLDEPRPTGKEGFDDGIDFVIYGYTVDLKTMGRKGKVWENYVNNLVASQCAYKTQVYIFASINKTTSEMTFIGAINKARLANYFLPKGTERERYDKTKFIIERDMYEIPNNGLSPIDSISDIGWSIHRSML